jgi:hypothetical protein
MGHEGLSLREMVGAVDLADLAGCLKTIGSSVEPVRTAPAVGIRCGD